jgi:hypothetical protein
MPNGEHIPNTIPNKLWTCNFDLGRFPKFTIGLNRLQIAFQNSFLNRLKPMVNFGTNRLFIPLVRLYNRDDTAVNTDCWCCY